MSGHRGTPWDQFTLTESGLYLSDNTIADVSTSRHGLVPKAPNDNTKFLRGDGTWAVLNAVAGSGSYPAEYDVRVKDLSPSSETDEFSSTSITGWTDVSWSTGTTEDQHTTQPGALWVSGASNSTWHHRLKAMPAGDGRIYTIVSTGGPGANFLLPGLCLADGTTGGAGNQVAFWNGWHSSVTATWAAAVQTGQNFNYTSPALTGVSTTNTSAAILRITRSGSNYLFGCSPIWSGGRVWFEKTISIGFTATYMGLVYYNATGFTAEIAWEFFRYYASATAQTGGAP